VCVYPAYVNARQTVARGRLIAKHLACDNPTFQELLIAAKSLGFDALPEANKVYPRAREHYLDRGRIKVRLLTPDKKPVNAEIPSRKALYLRLAAFVTQMPGRGVSSAQPAFEQKAANPSSPPPPTVSDKPPKKKKKKDKH